MSKRLTQERRDEIAKTLLTNGKISAPLLAKEYGVSAETIRKDLLYLEKNGIAKKGYGGAVVSTELNEQNFSEKSIRNQNEKLRIAAKAAEFVSDGDIVILDSGSTALAVAKQLVLKNKLTVFTNSLKTAQLLSDGGVKIYMLGGAVQNTSSASTGHWAVQALAEIKVNIAFLGTSGFYQRGGPCVENYGESEVKRAMITSANKSILVADASKAQSSAMIQFAEWKDFDVLITDKSIGDDTLDALQNKIEVMVV